jgi:hypothetical protein
VKVWVSAEWVVTRGHHGREVRTLRPGYFTYRTERVWVADTGRPGDYGRGPGHGYAYAMVAAEPNRAKPLKQATC